MCVCVPVPCVETAGVAVTPAGKKPHAFSFLPSHNSWGPFGSSQVLGSEKEGDLFWD